MLLREGEDVQGDGVRHVSPGASDGVLRQNARLVLQARGVRRPDFCWNEAAYRQRGKSSTSLVSIFDCVDIHYFCTLARVELKIMRTCSVPVDSETLLISNANCIRLILTFDHDFSSNRAKTAK